MPESSQAWVRRKVARARCGGPLTAPSVVHVRPGQWGGAVMETRDGRRIGWVGEPVAVVQAWVASA